MHGSEGSFLDVMRAVKLREVDEARRSGAAARAAQAPPGPGAARFVEALERSGPLAIIAEIKRASPSEGALNAGLDPVAQARRYAEAGAAAISVLTERTRFMGSLDDLRAVAAAVDVPVMRKDFVLDAVQIDEAAECGASAVLLIAGFVPRAELAALVAHARRRGLGVLMEIFAAEDLEDALASGARVVGVNARDLRTLEVDRDHVLRMGARLREELASGRVAVTVAESGIASGVHARAAREAGYGAALVGSALVRADDPGALVRELRAADGDASREEGA